MIYAVIVEDWEGFQMYEFDDLKSAEACYSECAAKYKFRVLLVELLKIKSDS